MHPLHWRDGSLWFDSYIRNLKGKVGCGHSAESEVQDHRVRGCICMFPRDQWSWRTSLPGVSNHLAETLPRGLLGGERSP